MVTSKFVVIPQDEQHKDEIGLLLKVHKMAIGLTFSMEHEWPAIKERLFHGIESVGILARPVHDGWVNRVAKCGNPRLKRVFKRRRTLWFGKILVEIYYDCRRDLQRFWAVIRITNHDFINGDQEHVLTCLKLHELLRRLEIPYQLSPLGERCEIALDSQNLELHEWMSERMIPKWTTRHKVKHWDCEEKRMLDGLHPEGAHSYLTNDKWSSQRTFVTYTDYRVEGKYRTLELRADNCFLRKHGISTIQDFITLIPDRLLSYVVLVEVDLEKIWYWQERYKNQGRFSKFYRSAKREWAENGLHVHEQGDHRPSWSNASEHDPRPNHPEVLLSDPSPGDRPRIYYTRRGSTKLWSDSRC